MTMNVFDAELLQLDAVLERSEVVTDVERPRRAVACQHAIAVRVFEEIRAKSL